MLPRKSAAAKPESSLALLASPLIIDFSVPFPKTFHLQEIEQNNGKQFLIEWFSKALTSEHADIIIALVLVNYP
jgi:hypothetical protein